MEGANTCHNFISQHMEQRLSLIKHLDDKDGLKQFPFAVGALESEAQLGHQDTGCFSVIPEGQGWRVLLQGAALLLVPHPAAKNPQVNLYLAENLRSWQGFLVLTWRYHLPTSSIQKSLDRYVKTSWFGKLL